MLNLLLAFLAIVSVFVLLLYRYQHHFIYLPRPYQGELPVMAQLQISELIYETSQGRQTAYLLRRTAAPHTPAPGTPLWFMFGGNGSLALDWAELIENFPDERALFLLLDYPGYGKCEGAPSPETIKESILAALPALAGPLGVEADAVRENLNVLGHSLGSAAALLFAADMPVRRVVLISPFTSMLDMACRSFGKPLCYLLKHHYDNRARLRELLQRQNAPLITILHGDADEVIPVRMSRELAALSNRIRYLELAGMDHNLILQTAKPQIIQAMTGVESAEFHRGAQNVLEGAK